MLGIGTEPSFAIGQRALLIQTGVHADAMPMRFRSLNCCRQMDWSSPTFVQ